mmetsp:Transcript_107667/g.309935  ORF Transcript_107667/g.309935 Transcript_107667/m.309935 type:complete len:323 (-) Transcript_107667:33-1001(-)
MPAKGKGSWKPKDSGKEDSGKESGKTGGKGKGKKGSDAAVKGGGKGKSKKGSEAAERGGGGKGAPTENSAERSYAAALRELYTNTAVKATDLDAKAGQLLDALSEVGKGEAACQFLAKSLEGVGREKVVNWKAYIFTLLRGFDKEVYEKMKDGRGRPRPRFKEEKVSAPVQSMTVLKVEAPEFVPGQMWAGTLPRPASAVATPAAATSAVAAPVAKEAMPQAKPDEGAVIFKVDCETEPGEIVAVIGGPKELGSWDPAGAAPMTVATYPAWKSEPLKVGGEDIEYKFVVLGEDKAIKRWEPIEGNRKLKAGEEPKSATFGKL